MNKKENVTSPAENSRKKDVLKEPRQHSLQQHEEHIWSKKDTHSHA